MSVDGEELQKLINRGCKSREIQYTRLVLAVS